MVVSSLCFMPVPIIMSGASLRARHTIPTRPPAMKLNKSNEMVIQNKANDDDQHNTTTPNKQTHTSTRWDLGGKRRREREREQGKNARAHTHANAETKHTGEREAAHANT